MRFGRCNLRQAWSRALALAYDRLLSDDVLGYWAFRWARTVLARRRPVIVGVTGSVGKTTTTKVIGVLLSHPAAREVVGPVWVAQNNLNNYVGLPLVVLGYRDWVRTVPERLVFLLTGAARVARLCRDRTYPRVLVLEYGTDRSGYMFPMVQLAPPDVAVVTTVGPAHLSGLQSLRGVLEEKSTLVRHMRSDGLAILGDNHAFVDDLQQQAVAQVVRVPGRGLELSRAIARVIGARMGLSEQVISAALSDSRSPRSRLERFQVGGLTVIDDSYNANPLSMSLALDTLAGETAAGRRVAVLGTMAELGAESDAYHEQMGRQARAVASFIVGVGDGARLYRPDVWFENSEACAEHVSGLVKDTDCVLVKGSASVELGKVVARLRESSSPGGSA